MKIELKEITVRELVDGYEDNKHDGVVGYGGQLDIRPPFQREFVYKDAQRDAVITTISQEHPLNVMYWAVREEGGFEIIDGQQRTISICQYVKGDFSHNVFSDEQRYFYNLQKDEQERLLNYELMVYLCSGTDSEKLEWFKTINIASEKLTDQELRNAVYSGSWVTDAKRYFSKSGCPAYSIGNRYLKGSAIRQEYLETAISWLSDGEIEAYMSKHQHKPKADELWAHFQSVINWVETTFPKYRSYMKGIHWGNLYKDFKDAKLDPVKLENEISKLMEYESVSNKKGIYSYVLTRKEKHLNIRVFPDALKREAYERQGGICPICEKKFEIEEMDADHAIPWHKGGRTDADNCRVLCREDNQKKSGR